MKQTIVIIIVLISLICNVQAQRVPGLNKDTLTWLKTHIEKDSNYFKGKPFTLVLDSLYGLKNKLKSYKGPILLQLLQKQKGGIPIAIYKHDNILNPIKF